MKILTRISLLILFCTILCICFAPGALAETIDSGTCGAQGDNLLWTLNDTGELIISGTGAMDNFDEGTASWFSSRALISSVTINEGVKSIGNYAFCYCSKLTNVVFPESLEKIGMYAFSSCSSLTCVTIPRGLKSMGYYVFRECSSLSDITIQDGVTVIGIGAFYDCHNLRNVEIPESVTSIGNQAFYGCSSLMSVTIPSVVTSIGTDTFFNCGSLTNVIIPKNVVSISYSAFFGCSGLISVTIPSSVADIRSSAFDRCSSLTVVCYEGTDEQWHELSIGGSNTPLLNAHIIYEYNGEPPVIFGISFDANGGEGTMSGQLAVEGDTIVLRKNSFTREYYSFTGWLDQNGVSYADQATITLSEDLVLTAQWARSHYIVVYDSNGGEGTVPSRVTRVGSAFNLPSNSFLPPEGKVFTGWNTKADGSGGAYKVGDSFTPEDDTTLYAQWKETVTISFEPNGGEGEMQQQVVIKGEQSTLNRNYFTRTNYRFTEWLDQNGNSYNNLGIITPMEDVILTAQWTRTRYAISFDSNGGGGSMSSKAVTVGDFVVIPGNGFIAPEGNLFTGWNTAADGSGTAYNSGDSFAPTDDLTLYAQWKEAVSITFVSNGGDGEMQPQTIIKGEDIELNRNLFSRTYYSFTGWLDQNGNMYADQATITPTQDLTLTAQWRKTRFTVTLDANNESGSTYVESFSENYLLYIPSNSFAAPSGKAFAGWNTISDGSGTAYKPGDSLALVEDVTLYAQWGEAVTITFVSNGAEGIMQPQIVLKGEDIVLNRNQFSRTYYSFSGWLDQNGNNYADQATITPTQNLSLTAQWTRSAYLVGFYPNGGDGSYFEQAIPVNTTTALYLASHIGYSAPVGMSFAGWNSQPDGSGNSYADGAAVLLSADLILYAQWMENISISEANFPDSVFRNYVASTFDRDRDDYLNSAEISWAVSINVAWMGISSLDGLEYFSSLESLDCTYNQLTTLNLENCSNLSFLDCFSNKISSLDITHCPVLLALVENTQATVYGSDIIEFSIVDDASQEYIVGPGEVIPESDNRASRLSYDDGVTLFTNAPAHSVNYVNFPDPLFRTYVSENYDTDQNGILSDEEIAAVTWIDCSGTEEERSSIASLRGVEHFTNLVMLDCSSNVLDRLDLSGNTSLEVLDCSNNRLRDLNISKNSALTTMWCYYNYLEALDLTGKPMLKELWCNNNWISLLDLSEVPNLIVLWCHDNKLSSIDVSYLPSLNTLSCAINWISVLDVSQNTSLTTLWCSNNRISELDLSHNPELKTLGCYANSIAKLDISKCPALFSLVRTSYKTVDDGIARYFDESTDNPIYLLYDDSAAISIALIDEENFPDAAFRAYVLSSIDKNNDAILSNMEIDATSNIYCSNLGIASLRGIEFFPSLTSLYCENNELTELNLTDCAALTTLYCNSNWLTELNLNDCRALTTLYCPDNDLSILGLNDCGALTMLNCSGNILSSIDLSPCVALATLNCNNNLITALDLSQNKALTALHCGGNMIRRLNVGDNERLKTLNCNDNLLDSLDLSKNTALTALNCAGNRLTVLDLEGFSKLRTLRCTGNLLNSIKLDGCVALSILDCSGNRLRELLPSDCTRLRTLQCSNNQLTTLDISGAELLSTLYCQDNSLIELYVSNCKVLKSLLCYANVLTSLDIRSCPALMSLFDGTDPVITNGIVTYGDSYSNSSVLAFDTGVVINPLPDPDFILPAFLAFIEDEAFTGGAFTYVKLPEQAVSIGWRAFADCPNLAYIYIPEETTQINEEAFGSNQVLTIIGVPGTTAATYAAEHGFTFYPAA